MVSYPIGCDPARLRRWLDDRLSTREQEELAGHLEACRTCRRRLHSLAGGRDWLSSVREFLGPDPEYPPDEPKVPASDAPSAPTRPGCGVPDFEFLGLADDPGGPCRLGPYEIVEVIGRGGMGVVLKGFDSSLNRFVAIKVLAPELATSGAARRRFDREAKAAAAIAHEHVIAIHAVDASGRLPYLVMPYVAGESLQQRLDREGPLELRAILRIGMQVAAGLAAAHAQGLVHRDIKPANILLENGVERVQITDFGLARAVDDASVSQSGVVTGTPQYMAPEQAAGGSVDHRADLFSLGSVLYALATGHSPFRAETTMAVLRRVCDETPRPIREVNPEIPDWFAAIVSRLHAKDPARRYRSAADVVEILGRRLTALQQTGDKVPDPELPAPPPRPPGRRTRAGTALLAALTAGLSAAGFLGVWRSGLLSTTSRRGPDPAAAATGPVRGSFPAPNPTVSASTLLATAPVYGVAVSPDGTLLAMACEDGAVRLWDLGAGRWRAPLLGHSARVWSVAFSPDGKTLASGAGGWVDHGRPGEVKLWDVADGHRRADLVAHSSTVFAVAFSPDGTRVASGSWDRTARVWDARNGRPLGTLSGHKDAVRALAFSPEGGLLATGSFDGSVKLWDADTLELRDGVRAHPSGVNGLAFSPDGATLATVPRPPMDETPPAAVKLWDVARRQVRATLLGHRAAALAVAFSPDGSTLATGGGDYTHYQEFKLWDPATGRERASVGDLKDRAECVAFSPDGRTLIVGGGTIDTTGEVSLWDLGQLNVPNDRKGGPP